MQVVNTILGVANLIIGVFVLSKVLDTKKDTSDEIEKENAQLFYENQTGEDY